MIERDESRAVLEVNPRAVEEAHAAVRRASGGPLVGVGVLVKDNIDTAGPLHTTAGSLALATDRPAADAPVVENLRRAGLVILGKTNLSEWANYRSTSSISGWSAVGGLTVNPFDAARSAGGSSTGSAVAIALGLARVAVGTETDGSIVCPAAFNGVVGLKPTHDLVPVAGVVPIARSQDTVGPMGATVRETAWLLAAMTGAADPYAYDPEPVLDDRPLAGLRIGLPRDGLWSGDDAVAATVEDAIAMLGRLGAQIVDPVVVPSLLDVRGEDERVVLDHELKAGLAAYLRTRPGAPQSLAEVIAFNDAHANAELALFGQDIFIRAESTTDLSDPVYLAARARCVDVARTRGLDAVLAEHRLDALAMPAVDLPYAVDPADRGFASQGEAYEGERVVGPTTLPAMAGYPMLTVPCGRVGVLPVGLGLVAGPYAERVLLRIGHAYEAAAAA